MPLRTSILASFLGLVLWAAAAAAAVAPGAAAVPAVAAAPANDLVVDFRYAPYWWQTCIGLPDDWQKTLVGKDGDMLYDYPGKFAGFGTRILADVQGGAKWAAQDLVSPRVPIVRTRKLKDGLELREEAFAAPPAAQEPPAARPVIERVGEPSVNARWAAPKVPCEAAYADIAVGWKGPVQYRFRARPGAVYTVVFGICEGYHNDAGHRIQDLQIEGKTRKTADSIGPEGKNVPQLFAFDARDENGDGWIDVAVSSAAASPDDNTILNVLWVFEGTKIPPPADLLAGKTDQAPLAHVACGKDAVTGRPRTDVLIVRLANRGSAEASAVPTLTILSTQPIRCEGTNKVLIGDSTTLLCTTPFAKADVAGETVTLAFPAVRLAAGAETALAVSICRGGPSVQAAADLPAAEALRAAAEKYWQDADLPYGHLQVSDPGVQAVLDSSIRNIYQAREIKKGLPAFQVGPTCYRGLWVVDGSFLLESITFLDRWKETRSGIEYLLSFQRKDGLFMLINQHWKETGIVLWAVTRHARLTGDKAWLEKTWPKVEAGFDAIRELRRQTLKDPSAVNAGLIPAGFSDGGLSGPFPEYTNVYWNLTGMKAAIAAAAWLGKTQQASDWQKEYDDFYATFRKAADRDRRTDPHGNRYLPICMLADQHFEPQRAQWAFLHAVFPGQVFAADDELVRGNMAMLRACECEGLVRTTGWVTGGVWNYFGGFYGEAWLWLGDGPKAARTLYAFANHASPLLCWREEQMPVGQGPANCGDMPHNWASAEFIRLVRDLLVLERGDELHLLQGLPPSWVRPGGTIRVKDVLMEFGLISMDLIFAADGKSATLRLTPPSRTPPKRIVLHQVGWRDKDETIDLPTTGQVERKIELK